MGYYDEWDGYGSREEMERSERIAKLPAEIIKHLLAVDAMIEELNQQSKTKFVENHLSISMAQQHVQSALFWLVKQKVMKQLKDQYKAD